MGLIANMKIGRRLGLGFALILAMTVAIAAVGAWRLTEAANATKAMMAVPLTILYFAGMLLCLWMPRAASSED